MAAFTAGDPVNAIVADVGQSMTKIGFCGDDFPRSYFRSDVAVLRDEQRRIQDIHYDFLSRPICGDNDGKWEISNPVHAATGLWYDGTSQRGADWDDLLQGMIRHGMDSALGTTPERHPLLLVERSYNPPPLRQQLLECMFEGLDVPALFLARDATMACYACGRTTGTVVDIGCGSTRVTPVYEGYVEQKGIFISPIAARAMDQLVLEHLDQLSQTNKATPLVPLYQVRNHRLKRAAPFHQLARLHIAQQCKQDGSGAAVNTTTANNFKAPSVSFQLPDGQLVDISSQQRFAVSELLLGGTTTGTDTVNRRREETLVARRKEWTSVVAAALHPEDGDDNDDKVYSEEAAVGISQRTRRSQSTKKPAAFSNAQLQKACASYLQTHLDQLTGSSIATMVCDAAFRCDRDQQASLLGNVVLGGGGACMGPTDQAVPDLLRDKVETIIHTHTPGWRVKVLAPAIQERAICSWLGGSILGSLGTFHEMWVTKHEYEEWGPAIVNRKCP